ncbi:TonB system transport protein ExbD [Bacillus subtilis]|uniref:TonB system transport protein ExbD n=1 Tax=Pseudochrobactrum asaccharolyticum TaxID=354351 RepID=UPI001F031B5E|nr:TonB system transport protein ExbD [Pseudochrobactrum asaccharolyticum]MCF7646273.1 TonB system transport protein ExbD [Pseudochrobactrum asaccharolyticum]MCF7673020.1 TonB system transport protein ExbD [Bacillus subtilis]
MGSRLREDAGDELQESHEINVTPFIDVMLVLLIIFMVAAPLATVDINVDLPAASATPQPRPDKPVYLTLKDDLSISLGNDAVPRDALAVLLDRLSEGNKETRIFLRADKMVGYGELMNVMNLLREAGYLKIALVGLETLGATDGTATPVTAPPAAGQSAGQSAGE